MSKFRKLLVEAIQYLILKIVFLVGFTLSVVPFWFLYNVDREKLNEQTFGQSAAIVLLLTLCFAISLGLFFSTNG